MGYQSDFNQLLVLAAAGARTSETYKNAQERKALDREINMREKAKGKLLTDAKMQGDIAKNQDPDEAREYLQSTETYDKNLQELQDLKLRRASFGDKKSKDLYDGTVYGSDDVIQNRLNARTAIENDDKFQREGEQNAAIDKEHKYRMEEIAAQKKRPTVKQEAERQAAIQNQVAEIIREQNARDVVEERLELLRKNTEGLN